MRESRSYGSVGEPVGNHRLLEFGFELDAVYTAFIVLLLYLVR